MSLNSPDMVVNGANSALMPITPPIKKAKTVAKWHRNIIILTH